MLYYELFNILASFEQFLFIVNLEDFCCPFIPILSVDFCEGTESAWIHLDFVIELALSKLPVGLSRWKNWFDVVVQEDISELLIFIKELTYVD